MQRSTPRHSQWVRQALASTSFGGHGARLNAGCRQGCFHGISMSLPLPLLPGLGSDGVQLPPFDVPAGIPAWTTWYHWWERTKQLISQIGQSQRVLYYVLVLILCNSLLLKSSSPYSFSFVFSRGCPSSVWVLSTRLYHTSNIFSKVPWVNNSLH